MNHQQTNFGPWTTSLDSGSRMQLSAFWKHRMRRLPGLASATRMPRRTLAVALMLAIAVGLLPLVKLVPAAPVDATKQGDFVATFSNGVSVELIGLSKNPSADAPWWKPDGTPLEERPYHRVMAKMGSTGSIAREICWRWRGIDGADVQTNWGTKPAYNGAGGGQAKDDQGHNIPELTAQAISMAGSPDTCTVKLSMSVPATAWGTRMKSQAGNIGSTSQLLPNGKRGGVSFMKPQSEGSDTLVTYGYQISGEVRLAALDFDGDIHIGKSSGGTSLNGFAMREVRFANIKPSDLKTWQLQTRQRKTETVEFRNVSLHRGKVSNVEMEMVETSLPKQAGQPQGKESKTEQVDSGAEQERKRWQKMRGLVHQLAEQEGYRLEPGQLLKQFSGPRSELREELQSLLEEDAWGEVRGLLFQSIEGTDTELAMSGVKSKTLAGALDSILDLKLHQIDCEEALLETKSPGDWVCSWDPRKYRIPTTLEVAAFEKILHRELPMKLSLEWKPVEQTVVIVKGKFKFSPLPGPEGKLDALEREFAKTMAGCIRFPARRSDVSASVGTFPTLLQDIGEVLGMTVIDEVGERSTTYQLFWSYTGKPVPGHLPLDPALEKNFLDSLSKQTGFQFVKEKRLVHKLFIKAKPAIASDR